VDERARKTELTADVVPTQGSVGLGRRDDLVEAREACGRERGAGAKEKLSAVHVVVSSVAILLPTIFTGLAKWARGAHFL